MTVLINRKPPDKNSKCKLPPPETPPPPPPSPKAAVVAPLPTPPPGLIPLGWTSPEEERRSPCLAVPSMVREVSVASIQFESSPVCSVSPEKFDLVFHFPPNVLPSLSYLTSIDAKENAMYFLSCPFYYPTRNRNKALVLSEEVGWNSLLNFRSIAKISLSDTPVRRTIRMIS